MPGDPATVAAVLASLLFLGGAAAIWPWTWSEAEREHHTAAAIWAQIRPTAGDATPWTRYGAWAIAGDQQVELVLISRRGTAEEAVAASPFTLTVTRRLDPDELDDAADAMEALRQQAAELETRAYERHRDSARSSPTTRSAPSTRPPTTTSAGRRSRCSAKWPRRKPPSAAPRPRRWRARCAAARAAERIRTADPFITRLYRCTAGHPRACRPFGRVRRRTARLNSAFIPHSLLRPLGGKRSPTSCGD